jgi:hypothetical protein
MSPTTSSLPPTTYFDEEGEVVGVAALLDMEGNLDVGRIH